MHRITQGVMLLFAASEAALAVLVLLTMSYAQLAFGGRTAGDVIPLATMLFLATAAGLHINEFRGRGITGSVGRFVFVTVTGVSLFIMLFFGYFILPIILFPVV